MNTTKQKQIHRYRKQSSGYQCGEGSERGKIQTGNQEVQTTMYKINEIQGYIVGHGEYSQYFIVTFNGA